MKSGPDSKASGITLRRLLIIVMSVLLLLLLLGNMASNLINMRDYMQQQLQSHAQDAATSLGLSLSTVVDGHDLVAAGSMIDAIYDSGYYRSIILFNLEGKPLIERLSPPGLEGVPDFFIRWVPLSTPKGVSEITQGWSRLGTLEVVSNPGFAYRDLWTLVKIQLSWFLVISLLGVLAIQGVLTMILKPLNRIEAQANAIRNQDFSARSPRPKTRELQQVAHAMNLMAERLEGIFSAQLRQIESLREQTYRDALTGLANRAEFDKRLHAEVESEQSDAMGSLILLQLGHFSEYNQVRGRSAGDALLQALGHHLKRLCEGHAGALVARRGGADFAIYLPLLMDEQAEEFVAEMLRELATIPSIKETCRNDLLHLGVTDIQQGTTVEDLLSQADMALRQAQSAGPNGWRRYIPQGQIFAPEERVRQASEWLSVLRKVLADQTVQLYFQPVYSIDRSQILHHQVLSRIQVDAQIIVAGSFLPMAERFGLLKEFDQLITDILLRRMQRPEDRHNHFCLNLSASSIGSEGFVDWLLAELARYPEEAKRLVIEVPEYSLQLVPKAVEKLAQGSRRGGFQFAIDRVGASGVPFNYLQRMPIHFIKMDHSFIRGIDSSRDNQFFLRTVIQIAHSQKIRVVAVGVEFEAEWQIVQQLQLNGAMGYYLCRPQESPAHNV